MQNSVALRVGACYCLLSEFCSSTHRNSCVNEKLHVQVIRETHIKHSL